MQIRQPGLLLLMLTVCPSLSSSKVMEHCENFKDEPMETNEGQEVNYGHRG